MILSDEDRLSYEKEVAELKAKYKNKMTLAYRRESSELGYKYKQKELSDDNNNITKEN